MTLHEDAGLFRDAVLGAERKLGISDVLIEKDYWVVRALRHAAAEALGQFVFKGGTSLSKAYGLIERFSEDIDLAVKMEVGASQHRIKQRLKSVEAAAARDLEAVIEHPAMSKGSLYRKTVHRYPRTLAAKIAPAHASEHLILEVNAFSNPTPTESRRIGSYVADFLVDAGHGDIILAHGLERFEIEVMSPERTYVEKIFSLVRAGLSAAPEAELGRKVRHAYDLHMLLREPRLLAHMESPRFFEMADMVRADDLASRHFRGEWTDRHAASCPLFAAPDSVWSRLARVYEQDFRELVFGDLPSVREVRQTLARIAERLHEWDARTT